MLTGLVAASATSASLCASWRPSGLHRRPCVDCGEGGGCGTRQAKQRPRRRHLPAPILKRAALASCRNIARLEYVSELELQPRFSSWRSHSYPPRPHRPMRAPCDRVIVRTYGQLTPLELPPDLFPDRLNRFPRRHPLRGIPDKPSSSGFSRWMAAYRTHFDSTPILACQPKSRNSEGFAVISEPSVGPSPADIWPSLRKFRRAGSSAVVPSASRTRLRLVV